MERFDAVIVGSGIVGLAAALTFHAQGFRTCLVGPRPGQSDGRTAALLQGSLQLLRRIQLGEELDRISAPLRRMRIVDDTGSLFRPPPVEFRADEIGLEFFGRNVENAALVELLADLVGRSGMLWKEALATGLDGDRVQLADGSDAPGELIVAADGRRSPMRQIVGVEATEHRYRQAALTTILAHDGDHRETSTEFHHRGGPFTLVPLPGRRSSLVWVTSPPHAKRLAEFGDADFAAAIRREARDLLGAMRIDGPRGIVPLSRLDVTSMWRGPVALVGEAAHALPPIGAQGLNLGLADVAALARVAAEARSSGRSIGDPATLARYEAARHGDVRRRSAAVDGLNRALLSDFLPVDALRGIGLGALARIGPLRRAAMRAGLMTQPLSGQTG